ncbi:GNAT family N-acetyltransferase [Polymorphobacter sp. PAMC 29334]|uniref:GNAT family N-acetyltransferase n=1 Tax=Polymorphobacter sp. PAMC 29334 TaxID=2862331 RepID=UPI001C68353B|nr:GNAT family N-acetyltransferase [Polymorphobacter sp. PAMC 29334]QYE34128.1 GNAT family N-acetyltransferase [Polymorphobacter sp. PAMC 29334]
MSADLQPTLRGELVALRPIEPDDWDALYAVASDPLIWAVHPVHDRWQEPVFRRFFDEGLASGGGLVATDPVSGAVIGFSRYDLARVEPGEVEIGWTFLARNYWGGAANADLKRLMIGHALRHFDRALFLVGEANIRSRRAMEKIGGRLTDRTYDADYPSGIVRHVIYAIDREGFAAGPLA